MALCRQLNACFTLHMYTIAYSVPTILPDYKHEAEIQDPLLVGSLPVVSTESFYI